RPVRARARGSLVLLPAEDGGAGGGLRRGRARGARRAGGRGTGRGARHTDAEPRALSDPRRAAISECASPALGACPVTAATKGARSSVTRETSVTAVAVAVRGTSRRSAISPNASTGPHTLSMVV